MYGYLRKEAKHENINRGMPPAWHSVSMYSWQATSIAQRHSSALEDGVPRVHLDAGEEDPVGHQALYLLEVGLVEEENPVTPDIKGHSVT